MSAGAGLGCDFIEMPLHGLGIATGQDKGGANAAGGTDGAEDIGRLGALVLGCAGPGASFCPAPGNLVLLANPGFVLPPQLYCGVGGKFGPDFRHSGGEVFLKSSTAYSFWASWRGRAVILT